MKHHCHKHIAILDNMLKDSVLSKRLTTVQNSEQNKQLTFWSYEIFNKNISHNYERLHWFCTCKGVNIFDGSTVRKDFMFHTCQLDSKNIALSKKGYQL